MNLKELSEILAHWKAESPEKEREVIEKIYNLISIPGISENGIKVNLIPQN